MTSRTSHVLRSVALAATLAVGAAACGGSTTTLTAAPASAQPAEAPPTAVVAADDAATEDAPIQDAAGEVPEEVEVAAPAPVDEPEGSGQIEVVFDDGRSWTLPATDCMYDPDGGLSTLIMAGRGEGDLELNVVETWPLGGDRSGGLLFLASFVDDTDQVYTIHAPADGIATDDGISFTSGVFTDLFAAEGDTPDAIATFRC